MLNFHVVRFRNFLSTGEAFIQVPLNSAVTTLIVGKNGVGKSQFIDAISFALFNKAFRRINKSQLVNSITGKNCEVEVEFDKAGHTYLIRRGIKPNFLEIRQDGELLKNFDDAEAYIERILGMNQKSFFQVVVLGAALYIPFMQLKVPERRAVVEDLLDIQVYTTMAQILKGRITELEQDRQKLVMHLNGARIRVQAEEQHLKSLQQDTEGMIEAKLKEIATEEAKAIAYAAKNQELKQAHSRLEKSIEDEKETVTTVRKYEAYDVQIKQRITNLDNEIAFYRKHSNCPTCKQAINEAFRENTVEEKKKENRELVDGRSQLATKMEELRKRIDAINDVKNQLAGSYNEHNGNQYCIRTCETIINKTRTEIDKLQAKSDADAGMLEQYRQDVASFEAGADKLTNVRAVMDAAAELLKDQGVRAQVIRKYLPVLNKLINHYLAQMEFMCHLELDEGFNETIKSRFRDDFSYESFSEGEKMRIDLAVLFAWREIGKLRNSSSTNLLVFDEVLDSSLDQDGADEFLNIVNDLAGSQHVLVISHRGDQLVDKFKDVIRFDKNRGFSVASRG